MTTTSGQLAGATALITGAGSGIGLACARALTRGGAKVHLVDRDEQACRDAAENVGGVPHAVDLAEPRATETLPHEVDVLVNNAGFQHLAPIHEFPADRFRAMHEVMVTAPFLLIRRCLPHMRDRGWGRIVNVSSVHGHRASPDKSAYVAAKHALEGLNKVAALEGAEYGVTSNCVAPGYVRTALVEGQVQAQADSRGIASDKVLDEVFLKRTAIKRLIEPDEIAAVVTWLCGPGSDYVTGTSIPVDGAWTAQ
ncbi:SDR family oxidoreductase [Allosaccharopolyspora coralli]|uniref:SDR family oxidoreductase n=1 Tax=Allosaccharopolyspora coralli TaxID=2665642 RepID=A0A5Q3QGD4_9PSEU|nr:3-hydroxybutyrate dehydrogenase [Allosaccharopolyspora coralli]QGK70529.1 SDR family oxidoreductase [Allosaccharopolyspora coralli]